MGEWVRTSPQSRSRVQCSALTAARIFLGYRLCPQQQPVGKQEPAGRG